MELSHANCLEILAHPTTQVILESLGYEYSDRGLAQYRQARPDILPALVNAIVEELQHHPIFPPKYRNLIPDVGLYIRSKEDHFVLVDVDEPSARNEFAFTSAEAAARGYVLKLIEPYWLNTNLENTMASQNNRIKS